MKETIKVTYTVKNDGRDIKKLASSIAIGQSTGTWDELSGNIRLQISKHLAEVVSIEENEFTSCIKIAFPIENFGDDIGALLTAVYGKISLAPKIKLEDIEFTDAYLKHFEGPTHGIKRIREITGKNGKPLLMCIFKPCLGLSASELGNMFYQLAQVGIDFIKEIGRAHV